MRARFIEAASNYRNIPVDIVAAMTKALNQVQHGVDSKDKAQFETAFDSATAACNACHVAAGVAFVQVRRPGAPAFGNLDFSGPAAAPRRSR